MSSLLLSIADTTAAQRGRAASHAQLCAPLQQRVSPAPDVQAPAPPPVPDPAAAFDAAGVRAAALRCTWALSDPGTWFPPEASDEVLAVALSAVREDERAGYAQRLEAFTAQHRERLQEMLRGWGPASTPRVTTVAHWPVSPRA
ncbi:hypothetical protein ABZ478_19360 [Streptomyces sp. NPDC005706]|uniref:hypothetical protein n=1 Tax=Streptomyces sp. NPDC005706 TaxID=3157169 RepID=UPI0034001576